MGPDPSVHLPGAVRPERSAVRQGHRLLPVLAAGLHRAQELDAVDPAAERASWPARSISCTAKSIWTVGPGASRPPPSPMAPRCWVSFRGQGLVLCAGPLPAALRRQRRRGRRRLHRCPCRAAGALAAHRPCRRRRRRRMGQCAAAHTTGLPSPRRLSGVRRLVRVRRDRPLRCSNASTSSRASCSWSRRTSSATSPSRGKPTTFSRSTVKPFPAEQGLTFQSLQDNRGTIDNIRLWDWQPLMDTYAQLQEIRTYYKFLDVDVDRYQIDGSYQQVMLAARELAPSLLPANAQTWVNLHLLFTHGNGVVMSPVTQKSTEGLPNLLPEGHPAGRLRRPADHRAAHLFRTERQWLRDRQRQHAGVRLSQGQGQRLRELRWRGRHPDRRRAPGGRCSPGISTTSTSCSAATSPARAGSCSIATSRIASQTIAPFLQLDHDPYVVVSGGRLYWMQDAYTTSDWFPYAQPQPDGGHQLHPQFGQGGHRRL